MAVVKVKVGGRDYQIACDEGQEEHLRLLTDEVNDRINALFFEAKTPPSDTMALLMAALMLADELNESKKETEYFMQHSPEEGSAHMQKLEHEMAGAFDEIAVRIEKIAEQMDLR